MAIVPAFALSFAMVAASAASATAQAQAQLTNADIPRDNQKGRYLNFERAQLHPMELSSDGTKLYALNTPGARVAVFDAATETFLFDIPVGIGCVSLMRRPGTEELWVVDELTSSISVIQPASANIVRTIRVGAAPHGIAFTDTGDRAYITCAGVDQVDVVSSASYAIVKSIAIPAREPRGIVWQSGRAWLVPLMSGNNTAGYGTLAEPNSIVGVKKVAGPGLNPLPDRDLFAIQTQNDPALDALDPSATRTGLGTTLFNVCPRPGTSELWIPNTDALNDVHTGEVNFVAGQVVSNRITIVDTQSAQPPVVIDLDQIAPTNHKCGQPTSVLFDPNGTRAFVTGYGNDLVAVLAIGAGGAATWTGAIDLPARQAYPRGTGPRALLFDPSGTKLWVYERVDDAITSIDLASLPSAGPYFVTANPGFSLGFDPLPAPERLGRHLFSNARFSKSQTSSCASCHIDGHTDGLVWELSSFLDPEGTPNDQLHFGMDIKGPLVTQSTRRLQETGPYHWRGEKRSINDFQAAFVNLLENQVNGQPAPIGTDFQYIRHYVDRLSYPANPREALDRDYTPTELAGATVFMTKPVLGTLTCSACHTLPIGTNGEIVAHTVGGVPHTLDVPFLRAVADKLAPPYTIGGIFGQRTELGAGLTHGGALPNLRTTILRADPAHPGVPVFNVTPAEANQIAAFLSAFDSGIAPAAGYQATVHPGNAGNFAQTELAYLEDQAQRGNCDLVFVRSPRFIAGRWLQLTGRYDTGTHAFQPASKTAPQLADAFFVAEAMSGRPVTFFGVPLGEGLVLGLDRDCDGLWDLDELRKGTDPENEDTDGDRFPDGYEIDHGMDPLVFNASSPDTQPPALAGPAHFLWATTNTIKFEIDTTEMCRVYISYNGGSIVQRLPLESPSFDTHHDVVLDELQPNTSYTIALKLVDPANNSFTDTSTVFQTRARTFADPAFIDSIALAVQSGSPNTLRADIALKAGAGPAGAAYDMNCAVYQVQFGGALTALFDSIHLRSGSNGVATGFFRLPPIGAGPSTIIVVVKDVVAPAGAVPYTLGLNKAQHAAIVY